MSVPETAAQRVPPQNIEAEASVLGSMLLDSEVIHGIFERLNKDHFYLPAHQKLFEVMTGLYERDMPLDVLLVNEEIRQQNLEKEVGGPEFLANLLASVPTAANAEYYADIVRQKASVRKLVSVCHQVLSEAYEGTEDADTLCDRAEQMVFEIAQKKQLGEAIGLGDILKTTFEEIDKYQDVEDRIVGLPTGFTLLDDMTCGLQKSELIIVAGRPSMGKTTFALAIADHVGIERKLPAVIFSIETSAQQIAQNLLCSRAGVNAHKMRRGFLPKSEYAKLSLAVGRLAEAPIFIDDSAKLSLLDLRAKARRLKARYDIQLIVIDYLQLMEGRASRSDSRQQEITEISRGLKAVARELDVPVIAISQLSRATEAREGHKPRMADLRESGSIEQDADVILLLYREEYYDDTKRPGEADVIVAKQRHGPTGLVTLAFMKEVLRVGSLAVDRIP